MGNHPAHERIEIRDWLAANPRVDVHFTPTSGSWLNLVEVWFRMIARQAIRRGSFISVRDFMTKVHGFVNGCNTREHPFILDQDAR
nr:transposase [Tessaracoccus antarcticus]